MGSLDVDVRAVVAAAEKDTVEAVAQAMITSLVRDWKSSYEQRVQSFL